MVNWNRRIDKYYKQLSVEILVYKESFNLLLVFEAFDT